jgi:hypothetical protein
MAARLLYQALALGFAGLDGTPVRQAAKAPAAVGFVSLSSRQLGLAGGAVTRGQRALPRWGSASLAPVTRGMFDQGMLSTGSGVASGVAMEGPSSSSTRSTCLPSASPRKPRVMTR